MSSYHMVSLKFVDWIVCVESSITYKQVLSEIVSYLATRVLPENSQNAMLFWHHTTVLHSGVHTTMHLVGFLLPLVMDLYIFWMEPYHSLSKCCR